MKQGLFLIFAFCAISNAYAETDCLQRPSCEELGYTQTTEECAGRSILPCPFNIADPNTVFCGNIGDTDTSCEEKCKTAYPLFAGQANTKAAISQIGNKALAAYAASQFYVGDKNGDFGQGKWYVPSIGEWMYAYGTDTSQITENDNTSGAKGDNKSLINAALNTLADKGVEAESWGEERYWTSSEGGVTGYFWALYGNTGYRSGYKYDNKYALRFSLFLTPSSSGTAPKIGDVMYSDKTYGSAADYDGSKTPVGVISSVSKDNRDVAILNLKDLTFSSQSTSGNFDPENPYGKSISEIRWSVNSQDITGIQNFNHAQFFQAMQVVDNCPCHFYPPEDDTPDNTCTGANKCKDTSGNCVECYSSCSAYDSSYTDNEPSGYTCSSTSVLIGSGNGATATSKTCYYDCSTIDTCTGANKCKDASGNCITCYASCSAYNSSYKDSQPSGQTCSTTSVMIGSGNGAAATSKTCYYNCSTIDTCTGANDCYYNGRCVDCYDSCEDYDSDYMDEEPDGYSCWSEGIYQGSGYGDDASVTTCYYNCSKIDTCTGSGQCKDSSGNCVTCYKSCSAYDSSYTDNELSGYSCSGKSVWIGSGYGATATSKTCYSCTCTGTNKCLDENDNCITCYKSCSTYNSSYKDSEPSGYTCSSTSVMIGSGNGATASSKPCYYNCAKIDTCTGEKQCKDASGNCITCYSSCSVYDSSYTSTDDKKQDGYSCSSTSVMIGSGYGATATSKTCYKCTCGGAGKCSYGSKCVDCYGSCSAYNSNYTDSPLSGYSCSSTLVVIGSGNGATATSKTCYSCTCTGSRKCLYNGKCVDCYESCSIYNINYRDNELSGYSCSGKSVMIGSGYGATATNKTCYSCTCTGSGKCSYGSKCVDCYGSCSAYNSNYTDSPLSGYSCSSTLVVIGSGNGATGTTKACYNCTCTGANKCKTSSGECVDCYSSCLAYSAYYNEDNADKEKNGYTCESKSAWIGSGDGATATSKTCYHCTCFDSGKCLYNGKCIDCYSSCSAYGSGYKETKPTGADTCSSETVLIGYGSGMTATPKTCYKCTCDGKNQCKTSLGLCVNCYESCSDYNSSYLDETPEYHSCQSKAIDQGSGYGATPTTKICYYDCKDTCTETNKCKVDGKCLVCYPNCSAYVSSYKDSEPSGYTCSSTSVLIGSGSGSTGSYKTCYYDCKEDEKVDTCNGAHQCKTSYGTCVDCYASCADAGYSETDCSSTQDMCSIMMINIGSGYGATVTEAKECYFKDLVPACGVANCARCMDSSYTTCSLCDSGYTLSNGGKSCVK